MRRTVGLCLAVLLILSLTACGGTGAVSSDLTDMSDVFVGDTVTTDVPPATTITTAPPTTTTTAPLTAEQKQDLQIKQDFLAMQQANGCFKDRTIEDFAVQKIHGTWTDALVVQFSGFSYVDLADYYTVAECRVLVDCGTMQQLYLYKNREFKHFTDAFNDGWITKEDVREIISVVFPYAEIEEYKE